MLNVLSSFLRNLNLQVQPGNDNQFDFFNDDLLDINTDEDCDSDSFFTDARAAASLINEWHSENKVQSAEQSVAAALFWENIGEICEKAPKALALCVNRRFQLFLSAPLSTTLHSSKIGTDAAAAISLYFALVRVPGSQAFGAFDVNVMRHSLSVLKRFFELAIASAPESKSVIKKGKSLGAQSGKVESKSSLQKRSNPRRSATLTHSKDKIENNDDNDDDDEEDEDEDDEDEDVVDAPKVKRSSSRASSKRRGVVGPTDSSTVKFSTDDVSLLESLIKDDFYPLIRDFSFLQNQELIPFAVDVIALVLTLPVHICSLSVPSQSLSSSDLSSDRSLLISSSESLLALLQPKHTSPLTTTRLILKRLKPFMLHGHGSSGSSKAAVANTTIGSISTSNELEDALTAAGALPDSPLLDLRRPACPPDVRIVRARALYLTRVLICDKVSGRVLVSLSSSAGEDSFLESLGASSSSSPSVVPITRTVLERLPAVTALLEHLCVGSVGAKADSRAIACDIIAHLRACLPHSLRRAFIRFLASMSKAGKAGYRLVATEVAARLLGTKAASGDVGVSEATALDVLGVSDTPTLALTLAELPRPSREDRIIESAGYGRDGADYAMGATANDDKERHEEEKSILGDITQQPSLSPIGSVRSSRSRRSSILLMGADNAHTPVRSALNNNDDEDDDDEEDEDEFPPAASSRVLKNMKSKKGGSAAGAKGSRSPFYKPLAVSATTSSSSADDIDGCCDPRPTAMILIDLLLRRSSDRAPGVRARAVSALAGLLDHEVSASHSGKKRSLSAARFLALLLAHCAHTQTLSEYAVTEATDGGVLSSASSSTGEVTLAGSHHTSFGAQYAIYVSSSSAIASNSNPSQTEVAVIQCEVSAPVPSPLVPLLVRRMHDVKPAVRKAALHASAAIALNGGAGSVIHSSALVDHATAVALKEEDSPDLLSWRSLQLINCNVLRKAKSLAVENKDNVAPSAVLGLYCLQSISSAASDASVLVRRQALSSFHSLLIAEPDQPALQSLWLATVLPLVLDSEQSIISKSVECVREALINELLLWHAIDKQSSKEEKPSLLVWKLLDSCANDADLSRCLSQAVHLMNRGVGGGELPIDKLIMSLLHGAKASEELERMDQVSPVAETVRKGSWLLLEILCAHFAVRAVTSGGTSVVQASTVSSSSYSLFKPVVPFLIRSWGTMLKAMRTSGDDNSLFSNAARVMRILSLLAPGLQTDQAQGLLDSVLTELQRFKWAPEVTSAGVRLIATLSASHAPSGQAQSMRIASDAWSSPLLISIEEQLRSFVVSPSSAVATGTSLSSALFTLGELSLIGLDADAGQGASESAMSLTSSEASATSKESRRRMVSVIFSERLITLVQSLMAPALTPAVVPATASTAVTVPDGVRALAYLCIGKICLRDVGLAKRFIAVLVRDLSPKLCTSAAVRNNVLFVLGDLCIRYTALVDRHIDAMTEVIADPNALVRRHAVALITQLVTSDYLKWRSQIFYRFAIAMADPDEGVRNAALGAVTGVLLTKNKLILQAHFVDLVFVLSGCTSRVAYRQLINAGKALKPSPSKANKRPNDDDNDGEEEEMNVAIDIEENSSYSTSNEVLSRLSIQDPSKRMFIYRTLLAAMPEEQRFTVHGKLAVEVLGGLLEGTSLKLTPPAQLAREMQQLRNTSIRQHRIFPTTPGASSGKSHRTDASSSSSSDTSSAAASTLIFPQGSTEALVAEVFSILSCPDMRVGVAAKGGASSKDDDDDAANAAGDEDAGVGGAQSNNLMMVQSLALAKSRLMSKLAKKQAVENVLPICIGLKQLFSQQKSPLRVPLMHYLINLFNDFGEDLREVLSADRQTAAELEFDLRQFQQAEAEKSAVLTELTPFGAGISGGERRDRRRVSLFERAPLSTPISEVKASPAPKILARSEVLEDHGEVRLSCASPSIRALEENGAGKKKRGASVKSKSIVSEKDDAPHLVVVLNNILTSEAGDVKPVDANTSKGGKRSRRIALSQGHGGGEGGL
jgi:hypothetical protein